MNERIDESTNQSINKSLKERKCVNVCKATSLTASKLSYISPSLKNKQPSILPLE
jgi:hypothetical protein